MRTPYMGPVHAHAGYSHYSNCLCLQTIHEAIATHYIHRRVKPDKLRSNPRPVAVSSRCHSQTWVSRTVVYHNVNWSCSRTLWGHAWNGGSLMHIRVHLSSWVFPPHSADIGNWRLDKTQTIIRTFWSAARKWPLSDVHCYLWQVTRTAQKLANAANRLYKGFWKCI